MKYFRPQQEANLFSILDHQKQLSRTPKGINRLNAVIDWELFRKEIESILGYDKRDHRKGGRPPFDPVLMLKVLVLQKFHGLSDDEAEYQIKDRFSFLEFLGLRAGDRIPDAKTIWDFKQALEKEGRDGGRRLFERFGELLEASGMVAKEGTLVDASFVDAPRQRNTREENAEIKEGKRPKGFEKDTPKGRQKDCDARWVKKNQETHYGYKNHAKVDAKSKLVTGFATTAAQVHDSQVFEELVEEGDGAVFADSAYYSEESQEHLIQKNCEDFIMMKAQRGHPLTEEEVETNRKRSRIRVRCEHVFGRMSQLAMDQIRTIGQVRAHHHNAMSNLVYNMDRLVFLCR